MADTSAVDAMMDFDEPKSSSAVDAMMDFDGPEQGNVGVAYTPGSVTKEFRDSLRKDRERREQFAMIDEEEVADSISRELQVPAGMVDTSGADFMTRMDFSFSDTDEDIREKFKQKFPNGEIYRLEYNQQARYKEGGDTFKWRKPETVLVYRENAYDDEGNPLPLTEENKIKTIEGSGAGYKDIADLAGPSLPFVASVGTGAFAPAGVMWGALATGTGYLAGELAKHEINIFGFDSKMSQEEAIKDAAKEGAEVAVLVGLTGGAYHLGKRITQKGAKVFLSDASDAIKTIRHRAMTWVESVRARGANVPNLSAEQIAPENAILDRLARQAKSTSAEARHRGVAQRSSVVSALENELVSTPEKIGRQLQRRVARVYRAAVNTARKALFGRTRTTLEQGGEALTSGGRAWQLRAGPRGELGREYALLDDIADEAAPVFALNVPASEGNASVRTLVHETRNAVNAEARALQTSGVNVADTPVGAFARILDDIDSMSSTQFDHNVLKQLRTRLGRVIERWPWDSSINSHYARRMYGALTDVMMNPVNSSAATARYVEQAAIATGKSRAYYDMLDDAVIRRVLQSESPGQLANAVGQPLAMNANIRRLISDMPEQYSSKFKTAVLTNDILLNPKGAMARIDDWELMHPEGYSFLLGKDKVLARDMRRAASAVDDLRASNLFEASQQKDMAVAKTLLRGKDVGRSEIQFLWNKVGQDGKQKLRAAMYHDIVDSVVKEGEKGIPLVDPNALAKIIREYKKTGAWNIVFGADDVNHILGMKAYIDLAYKTASDAGVSLQAAEAISQLKKPSTFISGAHRLTVNSLAARLMMNKHFVEWVATHNLDKPIVIDTARSKIKFMALAFEALLEGTEPGQQVDPLSENIIDPVIDAVQNIPEKAPEAIKRLSELEIPEG